MNLQVRSALEGQLEGKLELILAVQSPTWSSESHLPLESSLKVQLEPKTLQELLKTLQETPKRLQVGLQRRPRGAQDAPRGAQDAPRAAQDAPSWAPTTSKRGPRATKQQSKRNWTANSATLQKPLFSSGKLTILQVRSIAIDGKMSLGGKLRPMLTPSWLVRVQVGAKRGNLTLLGGLRSTKLALKGALGATKEAPRGPKRAMPIIDTVATGVRGG